MEVGAKQLTISGATAGNLVWNFSSSLLSIIWLTFFSFFRGVHWIIVISQIVRLCWGTIEIIKDASLLFVQFPTSVLRSTLLLTMHGQLRIMTGPMEKVLSFFFFFWIFCFFSQLMFDNRKTMLLSCSLLSSLDWTDPRTIVTWDHSTHHRVWTSVSMDNRKSQEASPSYQWCPLKGNCGVVGGRWNAEVSRIPEGSGPPGWYFPTVTSDSQQEIWRFCL